MRILGERNFFKYFTAANISFAGTYAGDIALTFGILGAWGPGTLATVLLARELMLLIFLVWGGVVADRHRREVVIASAAVVQACTQTAVGWILLTSRGGGAGWLVALGAANGASIAFGRPARTGIVPLLIPRERLQEANALLGASQPLFGVAGLAIGGGLSQVVEPGWALIFDAVTFAVSAALFSRLKVRRVHPPHEKHATLLSGAWQGWREVRSRSWVCTMIVFFAVVQLTYFPSLYVLASSVAKGMPGGAFAWSLLLALQLFGGVLGGVTAGRLKLARPLIIVCVSSGILPLELLGFAVGAPLWLLAPMSLSAGLALALANVAWATTLQAIVPSEVLGRVSSFDWVGSLALAPVGYALVGPLAAAVGRDGALAMAALAMGLASLVALGVPATRHVTIEPVRSTTGEM